MSWDEIDVEASDLDPLPDVLRHGLVEHWRRRAISEDRIGRGFAAIAPRLADVGAPEIVVRGCRDAASEEARHAELCMKLARRYAGGDPGRLEPAPLAMPDFRTGDERLELLFLIAGTCCINETLAVAYIHACLDAADDPVAVLANRAHLRDEVGHGRLGWALLRSSWVDDRLRLALAERLPRLFAANVPLWLRVDPALGAGGAPSWGHPDHDAMQNVILTAVKDAVVAGFTFVGVDTALVRDWTPART